MERIEGLHQDRRLFRRATRRHAVEAEQRLQRRDRKALSVAALLAFCALTAAAAQDTKPAAPADLPEGAGKPIVAAQCVGCHDLSRITTANHSAPEWRNVVAMMLAAGARLSPAEKDAVTQYLIERFPDRARS